MTSAERLSSLGRELQDLAGQHLPDMTWPSWLSETDRWHEFLFCLTMEALDGDAIAAREVILRLAVTDLLNPETLARLTGSGRDDAAVAQRVLRGCGLTEAAADELIAVLSHAASIVQKRHGGKIQLLLRAHALAAQTELATALADSPIGAQRLNLAVGRWLQNASMAPILLGDADTLGFCERRGVTLGDLEAAIDGLGLNAALVDDLIRVSAAAT